MGGGESYSRGTTGGGVGRGGRLSRLRSRPVAEKLMPRPPPPGVPDGPMTRRVCFQRARGWEALQGGEEDVTEPAAACFPWTLNQCRRGAGGTGFLSTPSEPLGDCVKAGQEEEEEDPPGNELTCQKEDKKNPTRQRARPIVSRSLPLHPSRDLF